MFKLFKKSLILFYSSRRGGSTLMAQLLDAEPKVGYVDQPFDLWKPNTKRGQVIASYLPQKDKSQFFELDAIEFVKVKAYLRQLYKLNLGILSSKKKAKQLVLKIVNAHGLIDQLPQMVPSKTIVLLRHPFAQALSVIRNGWGTCELPFLESKAWSSTYLKKEQQDYAWQIIKTGTNFERAVLNWCLEWVYPAHFSNTNYLKVHYEDLVLEGESTVKLIYDYLGFKNTKGALQVLHKPSRSSTFSMSNTIDLINNGEKKALLSSWRKHVTEEEQIKGQKILTIFNMTMYNMNSDTPVI